MSPLPVRSPKHCAKRELTISKCHKKILYAFSAFSLSILSLLLIVWAILHPSKPEFSLKETDIFNNSISSSNNINISSIQVTLVSQNPNKKVGIYYDELQACAYYKGEPITKDASLSSFYQDHEEINILSANLARQGPPIGPVEGEMVLILRADGRLRWRVGSWVSGAYKIKVQCVGTINLGHMLGSSSLNQETRCLTSV